MCTLPARELPAIARMVEALGSEDRLRLVMVNTAETEDDVFAFLGAVAPGLDTLLDRGTAPSPNAGSRVVCLRRSS